MRKVVLAIYVSLDGVVEEPAWTGQFWNDDLAKLQQELLFASDALLLGRVTYQGFAAAWPAMTQTGDFGVKMNTMPKFVASRTLRDTTWNATLIKGDVPEEVAKLKGQPGQDLLIYGSSDLVQTLIPHDLIDQYRLIVFPVILGKGKRLFTSVNDKMALRLIASTTTSTGVVISDYEPVRTESTKS